MSDKIGEISRVVKLKSGDTVYYFGTFTSDKLKALTFVPVLDKSKKSYLNEESADGYQRQGNPSRMNGFKSFLEKNTSSVTPPILLSGRGGWHFEPEATEWTGKLVITEAAAIIDGQHRAGGYVHLYEKTGQIRDVAFILLNGLAQKEEIATFITVNNTQVGVAKSTTAYLEDEEEAQIAWNLNTEPDSPFKGRISRGTMERQHLFALHSVAKEIDRLFSVGAVKDLDVETKTDFAKRFFTFVADHLHAEWFTDLAQLDDPTSRGRNSFTSKLLELTGLVAWCYTGAQILSRSYHESTAMNWENVDRLVLAASNIEWSKNGQYLGRTGVVGAKAMANDMIRLLPAEGTPPD